MRHLRVGGYASELSWARDTGQWTVFKHFSDQNSSQIVEKTAEKNGFKIMRFREYNLIYLKEIILNKNLYMYMYCYQLSDIQRHKIVWTW